MDLVCIQSDSFTEDLKNAFHPSKSSALLSSRACRDVRLFSFGPRIWHFFNITNVLCAQSNSIAEHLKNAFRFSSFSIGVCRNGRLRLFGRRTSPFAHVTNALIAFSITLAKDFVRYREHLS